MSQPQELLSFPYKLPRWISGFFIVLITLALVGIYYQATTTGFKTRSGGAVSPWLMGFLVSVLILSWLAALRILQLSFDASLRLSLNQQGISMPKHALSSTIIHLPYDQIESVQPHVLKPDILIVKTIGRRHIYTIQCNGFPSRTAFEQVQSELLRRVT